MNKSLIYFIGIIISFISILPAKAKSDSTVIHNWFCLGTGKNEIPERSKIINCDVA